MTKRNAVCPMCDRGIDKKEKVRTIKGVNGEAVRYHPYCAKIEKDGR